MLQSMTKVLGHARAARPAPVHRHPSRDRDAEVGRAGGWAGRRKTWRVRAGNGHESGFLVFMATTYVLMEHSEYPRSRNYVQS